MTTHHQEHLEALTEIRSIMERSSRFISLSGLSGVAAGIWALLGASAAFWYLGTTPFGKELPYIMDPGATGALGLSPLRFFLLNGTLVLVLALSTGIYFTTRKARKRGLPIWDRLTRRLLINLFIPLAAGGVFCLALLKHGEASLVAPATLIFYGLALLNASKYTLNDIRYLGLTEIGIGLLAAFFPGYGLEFWALGFGLMHIVYGTVLYFKYERGE
ncbi:MAG: hypothetical protein RIC19_01275 [Phaeodactylibacter sp.]|uniref:hypothetical protein n=1 Tax=Phaeodactylibacter sp. TaxID=1940289 RepID=UPI0032ECA604